MRIGIDLNMTDKEFEELCSYMARAGIRFLVTRAAIGGVIASQRFINKATMRMPVAPWVKWAARDIWQAMVWRQL